jgi:hypothetical protein
MLGDFWPVAAACKFWIRRNLFNRCRNELSVTPQRLWAKILLRPGKDARNIAARPRSDNDFHFLAVAPRSFRPDLAFNFRDESANRLLAVQDDSLALIDFIESLFGCPPKRFQLRLPFLLLFLQKTQRLAYDSLALL